MLILLPLLLLMGGFEGCAVFEGGVEEVMRICDACYGKRSSVDGTSWSAVINDGGVVTRHNVT